jgi:hypothetical protein
MPVWAISSAMSTANFVSHSDLTGCDERSFDCRPDRTGVNEDQAVIAALAQKDATAIAFGDAACLLGMTFLIITVIDLSLKAFHFH